MVMGLKTDLSVHAVCIKAGTRSGQQVKLSCVQGRQ